IFGNRQVVIAREITKLYEEYIRGSITEVIEAIDNLEIKGECCLVIEGSHDDEKVDELWWRHLSIPEHVNHYEEEKGLKNKAATIELALDPYISRQNIYQIIHVKNNNEKRKHLN